MTKSPSLTDPQAAAPAEGAARWTDSGPRGTAAHHSGLSIIASKISPAMPGRSVLSRPRLVDWLLRQSSARLILVSAEAGYGKTTLLNEFALQTRDACVWYRMEASDGDWITFLSYMVAALRDVWPGFGKSTEALLRNVAAMGSTREVVLAQFLADLGDAEDRRVAVILDDYHFVEDSPDIRMILGRLLERAPASMYFIFGGRGAPNLSLGRLTAQGRVAELTVDDLRFTLDEIEQLFSTTYGQPLDTSACRTIARRTDGWAASLQLVAASIAASQPGEVAAFIDALSGATGPIYDFLAEEVLTRLSPRTQRILMHASMVELVHARYVSAALGANGKDDDLPAVGQALAEAEALGLLGDRSRASNDTHMHPLFREFLEAHLLRGTTEERLRAMHRAIALEAEPENWLMAAKHFAHGGEDAAAMRVLGSAASEALGTGAWGAAMAIVDLLPKTAAPPAVKVIQARSLISDERLDSALALLADIDRSEITPEERGLVGLTCAAVHHMTGDRSRLAIEVEAVASDAEVPSALREVGVSWQQLLAAVGGGDISEAGRSLHHLESGQRTAGLHYFLGVTLHNRAYAELASGDYAQARDTARDAVRQLGRTDDGSTMTASTKATEAAAIAEMGGIEDGLRLANACATEPGATADAIADAAYLHAVCGRTSRAATLLARLERGDSRWARELGSDPQAKFARVAFHLTQGDVDQAAQVAADLERRDPEAIDARSRTAVVAATVAILRRQSNAIELAQESMQTCSSQHAWRWMARARLLDAAARRDSETLALWINETAHDSAVAVLELADAIATCISELVPLPETLERSILREPDRWVRALSRQVLERRGDDAAVAASLVARYGTADQAEVLRRFDRLPGRRMRRPGYATQLIRRVSPVVRVHDLGLTSYEVGERKVMLTQMRRKSAALMLYLITRPDFAATREQVMESLWPDQTPKSAMNSLHQTIFFLRRDIEPWYEDGSTADYVRLEGEVVRLDTDLFQVDSVAFARQASAVLASGNVVSEGAGLLQLYAGSFAPEFEYEEWATEWRTHLQTVFLRLAHATSRTLAEDGQLGDVVDVLGPVVALDPTAYELRAMLVGCLAAVGATDAAQAHYRSLRAAYERDLGIPFRSYAEVVGTFEP